MHAILRLALIVSLLATLAVQGRVMAVPAGAATEAAGMHHAPVPDGHPPARISHVDCGWLCTGVGPVPIVPARQASALGLPAGLADGDGLLPSGITPAIPDPPPRAASI